MDGESVQKDSAAGDRSELHGCRDRLQLLQRIGGFGYFEWDILAGSLSCSGEFETLYGIETGAFPCTWEGWNELIHPEDRQQAERQLHRALETGRFEAEWRVVLPDGSVRWLGGRGSLFRDAAGNPERLVGVNIDITLEKTLEEEVNDANLFLESVMQSISSAVFVLDREGRFVQINAAGFDLFGYDCIDILGRPFTMLLEKDAAKALEVPFRKLVDRGIRLESVEVIITRKDGSRRTLSLSAMPFMEDGCICGLVGVAPDVTEQKETERLLRDSEEKFRDLADNIAQFAWMADAEGRLVWFNKRWYDYTGTTPEEMENDGWKKLQHPDYLFSVTEKMSRCFRTGEFWEDTMPLKGKDGGYRWFLSRAIPIKDDQGRVARWFGTNTDITDRREMEESLRRTEERLSLAQQAAGIGMWNWDLGADGPTFSDNYYRVLGIGRQSLSFEEFLDLLHPDDRQPLRAEFERALSEGGQFEAEFRVFPQEGQEKWIMGRGRVYSGDDGAPLRVTGIILDITEQKQYEEELKRTLDDLGRSNRELEQFAYVASHDLQEPLRMVSSYLRLLEKKYKEKLDEKADLYIHFAVDGAERMQKLIEGLLSYSRITSRRAEFAIVDSNSVFAGAVANLEQAVRESGAHVTRDALPQVKGDETQLMQLMQNLIANSVKYRRKEVPPRVHVTAHREGKEWIFAVRDNGIGIAPEHHDRIFKIFQRLHTQEEYQGTGIGLASCKKIVEHHHGRIWVESTPGEGSTFFFSLPLDRGAHPHHGATGHASTPEEENGSLY